MFASHRFLWIYDISKLLPPSPLSSISTIVYTRTRPTPPPFHPPPNLAPNHTDPLTNAPTDKPKYPSCKQTHACTQIQCNAHVTSRRPAPLSPNHRFRISASSVLHSIIEFFWGREDRTDRSTGLRVEIWIEEKMPIWEPRTHGDKGGILGMGWGCCLMTGWYGGRGEGNSCYFLFSGRVCRDNCWCGTVGGWFIYCGYVPAFFLSFALLTFLFWR